MWYPVRVEFKASPTQIQELLNCKKFEPNQIYRQVIPCYNTVGGRLTPFVAVSLSQYKYTYIIYIQYYIVLVACGWPFYSTHSRVHTHNGPQA